MSRAFDISLGAWWQARPWRPNRSQGWRSNASPSAIGANGCFGNALRPRYRTASCGRPRRRRQDHARMRHRGHSRAVVGLGAPGASGAAAARALDRVASAAKGMGPPARLSVSQVGSPAPWHGAPDPLPLMALGGVSLAAVLAMLLVTLARPGFGANIGGGDVVSLVAPCRRSRSSGGSHRAAPHLEQLILAPCSDTRRAKRALVGAPQPRSKSHGPGQRTRLGTCAQPLP